MNNLDATEVIVGLAIFDKDNPPRCASVDEAREIVNQRLNKEGK